MKASKIILVVPYLAYMRQDKKFNPGEAVTSAYFAQLLSQWADELVTIDPHLHRKHSMDELYTIPCKVIHAAPAISAWIKQNIEKPVLIGPDAESTQWVSETAGTIDAPYIILEKNRLGDNKVEVSVPEVEAYKGFTPVLVDDIISTARTMIETVKHIRNAGMKPPVIIGVHAVFAGSAFKSLQDAGTSQIVTCNTINHMSSRIDVAALIHTYLN
jgi:ribose-phosphate pyrophosphokinase